MLGWKILFMNPAKRKGKDEESMNRRAAWFFVWRLRSYLLMAIWKGICQEDLLAPSKRLPHTALWVRRRRRHRHIMKDTLQTEELLSYIWSYSSLHAWGSISFPNSLLVCSQTQAEWEISRTCRFPRFPPFLLSSNVFQAKIILSSRCRISNIKEEESCVHVVQSQNSCV